MAVRANIGCQSDYIGHQLSLKHLGTPVRDFSLLDLLGWEAPPQI